ncbi:hypothetical protein OIE75_41255 (plasmid) [Streptomyces sp. NBC_01723]|uniref:hypothetical protein n=1 Tax=Streptomyces sp. NBC_01723 TaxID=2975921 RepID=UPI002E3240C0|nr:hypothetical protein [Streptomyces sp. NBC_01723]
MNARSRQARHTLRNRTRSQRAAARIARRGTGTLASHALAAGLTPTQARSVASSLRKNVAKAGVQGVTGIAYRKGQARTCTRYSRAEVAAIAAIYRPRRAEYKICAARLALAA